MSQAVHQQVCSLCNRDSCNFITGCYHHFHLFCLNYFYEKVERGKCPNCKGPISFDLSIETNIREYK